MAISDPLNNLSPPDKRKTRTLYVRLRVEAEEAELLCKAAKDISRRIVDEAIRTEGYARRIVRYGSSRGGDGDEQT